MLPGFTVTVLGRKVAANPAIGEELNDTVELNPPIGVTTTKPEAIPPWKTRIGPLGTVESEKSCV
jgi:hypothetical protein